MPSEDGWLTLEEKAAQLGVGLRTVERWASAGKLETRARGRGFPTLYHPSQGSEDGQASHAEVRTGVLAPAAASSTNGHGAVSQLRGQPSPIEDLLVRVLQAALVALPPGPPHPSGPPDGPPRPPSSTRDPWMTPFAVARAWAWPRRVVLKMVEEGKLGDVFYVGTPARPRAVVRRSAVEAFAAGRKDPEAL